MNPTYEGCDPQDDYESARDQAIEQEKQSALAEPITEDDVYQFACSLEIGRQSKERERIAELMRQFSDCTGETPLQVMRLAALGRAVYDLLNENRAHRAEQRFWDEQ